MNKIIAAICITLWAASAHAQLTPGGGSPVLPIGGGAGTSGLTIATTPISGGSVNNCLIIGAGNVLNQQACAAGSNPLSGTVTAGNIIVGGPSTSQIQDGSAVTLINVPSSMNITGSKVISGASTPSNSPLWLQTSLTGTATLGTTGFIAGNTSYISGDAVDTTTTGGAPGFLVGSLFEHVTSASSTGGRTALMGYEVINGLPTLVTKGYVGVQGQVRAAVNMGGTGGAFSNYVGSAEAGNSNAFTSAAATNLAIVAAHEFDVGLVSGSNTARKLGITVALAGNDTIRGDYEDYAIQITNAGSAVTWKNGLVFGGYGEGLGFGADSTLIAGIGRTVPSPTTPIALWGIDFSAFQFQSGGGFLKSNGFIVDPNGNITSSGAGAASTASLLLSGLTFTGGSGSTTLPTALVQPSGTTSSAWSTAGTAIGANMASGFTGRLLDLQLNGTSSFNVSNGGLVTAFGGVTVGAGVLYQWSGRGILSSPAAGDIQFGAANSSTVVAQTLSVQNASGSNVAGQNTTIIGSLSTGTATDGDIIFQTGVKNGSSGAVAATPTTALTLKGETQQAILANLASAGTQCVQASSTGALSGTGSACGGSGSTGANPTATAGPTAINGSSTNFMRADAAPAVQAGSASQQGIVQVDGTTITASAGTITAVPGATSRTVTGSTDTILSTDRGNVIYYNSASSIAVTQPAPTGAFASSFYTQVCNINVGAVTITPGSGTIYNGATLVLKPGSASAPSCSPYQSNGTNFNPLDGGILPGTIVPNVVGTVTTQSGTTYTFAATDCGTEVTFSNAGAVTATIPQTLPAGCNIAVAQLGAGKVSVNGTAVTPVTLHSAHSYTGTSAQYAVIGINVYSAGTPGLAILTGDGS